MSRYNAERIRKGGIISGGFCMQGTRDSNRQGYLWKEGVRNPPRRVWEREEKAFSEFSFRHRLSCGTDTVPSFLLGTGEAVVGDLDGMFKDFDGIEGIEQFGFADKG